MHRIGNVSKFLAITLVFFLHSYLFVNAQTYTTPGTYTWTVPPCVTEVTVKVWGAGGGGGGASSRQTTATNEACSQGGGGGGGGFSTRTYSVTPGDTYTIVVGAGGAGGVGADNTAVPGATGGASTFAGPATVPFGPLTGNGGAGGGGATSNNTENFSEHTHIGSNGNGGAGGGGANGTANYIGGSGSAGSHSGGCKDISGAGGGGAGTTGHGSNGQQIGGCPHNSAMQGGTGASVGGGNGGNGVINNIANRHLANGNAGSPYGGGGGGAGIHLNNWTQQWNKANGGAGAHGAVIIEYAGGTTPPPTANAQNFCSSATIADLVAAGTDLQWYSSATGGLPLAPDTPLTAGTYYVSQTINGCESERTPVQVTMTGPPEPQATDQSFCVKESPTIADLTATGNTLQWYSQATGGTPLPPSTPVVDNTTYYVSQTVGGCESGRTPVLVTINNPAPPNASNQNFCSNETITLADLTVQGASVQWYSQSSGGIPLSPTTSVTDNTTYYVSQTVNDCESDRTPVLVIINTSPVANAGNNTSVACNIEAQLGGAPSSNYEYLWTPATGLSNPAVSNPLANPAVTTTYELTVTDNTTGCSSVSQVTVTVEDLLTPVFTNPGPVCAGTNFTLPVTSDNGVTGTWSPAVNNSATTTYTFTPDGGCAQSVTMEVIVSNQVIPTFTNPGPICSGTSLILPTVSDNGISGTWSPSVNTNTTTVYTFTPNGGCSESVTMEVVVNNEIIPVFTNPGPVCTGTSFTLPAVSDNGVSGTWSPAVNNSATTTYTFTPQGGCSSPVTMTVVVGNQIIPAFTNPGTICSGTSFILPTVSDNGVAGTWSPAVNNTATTTYTFTPNQSGCAVSTTMEVIVIPDLTVSIAGTTDVCQGGEMPAIIFSANGGIAPYTYTYSVGNSSSETIISTDDSVFVSLANDGGFNINNTGCYDITIEISASGGCSNTAVFPDYLCVHPKPQAAFGVSSETLSGTVIMNNQSVGATNYAWNFGDGSGVNYSENPTHNFSNVSSETYVIELIAYSAEGCSDTTFRTVKIEEELVFYVPNTFTPDGDEYNNIFRPVLSSGYDLSDYSLDIYNRWGEHIFTSHNADIGWDGTYDGGLAQDGIYTWKIVLKIVGVDDRKEYVGHLNIIR